MARLSREFYTGDTVEIARALLGKYLVRRLPDGTVLVTTPLLQPGEYLLNAYPETLPAAGSYGVTLTMLVYHEEQDPAAEEPFATYTEQATLTVPQDAALRPE